MIAVSLVTWYAASFGAINNYVGAIFLLLTALYTVSLVWITKKAQAIENKHLKKERLSAFKMTQYGLTIFLGLAALIVGARGLIEGSVIYARYFGLSELVIGLTIIAAGTSMPEVATSIVAALKGERDIAVGNVVGSNIYNILAILGTAAVLTPGGLKIPEAALNFDIPVMVATSIACLPIFFTGHTIMRWEGIVFLTYYLFYVSYVVMTSTLSPWLGTLEYAILFFMLPLTGLTLAIGLFYSLRPNR